MAKIETLNLEFDTSKVVEELGEITDDITTRIKSAADEEIARVRKLNTSMIDYILGFMMLMLGLFILTLLSAAWLGIPFQFPIS